jgi:hypothetical protein
MLAESAQGLTATLRVKQWHSPYRKPKTLQGDPPLNNLLSKERYMSFNVVPVLHWIHRRLNKLKSSLFASVALVVLLSSPALGQCPPGAQQLRVERTGDEERTLCKCLPGYVQRQGQCILKLPTVDPAFFVSAEHTALVNGELERLRARKQRLEKQLSDLDQLREEQDGYLQQMGEMREQVVYDCVADVLAVVSTTELLTKIPGISVQAAEEIAGATKLFKSAVDAVASAQAGQDRQRAREKALDAHASLLGQIAKMAGPEKEKEALSKLIEASFEVVKAMDANQKADGAHLGVRVAKALDGIAAVAGIAYAPLGAARSAVHATGAGIVLWRIEHDKQSLVDALVSSQRAKLAAHQRLVSTDELMKFYEIENKKAGKE